MVLVLYPQAILNVFGASFVAGTTVLVLLAFAELMNAGTGICGPLIDMTGHTRVKLANTILWTVLLIGGDALLIPRWGVVGAATASLIAIGTVNVVTVAEVWILERLIPYDRSFWKPVVAGLAALTAGFALRAWMPVGTDIGRAIGQGIAVGGIYGGLMLLFGLEPDDRLVFQRVVSKTRRVLARRRPAALLRERSG
jgi:O-antigen/teichoic acid export membrane protein